MTECPFCRSSINDGATVCAACGAHKGTAMDSGSGPGCLLLILTAAYLGCGPLVLLGGILISAKGQGLAILFGGAVTVGGFFVLRACFRWTGGVRWYRKG